MRIQVEIVGTTPMLMHNERLSNPEDEIVKQIKELTAKKNNKTEKDNALISKLEWFGGLYTAHGKIVMPMPNLIRCFRDTAAISKLGKKVAGGLTPLALNVPLQFDDDDESLDDLFANPIYTDKRQVKVGRARIVRTRPLFPNWGLVAGFEMLEGVLNFDEVVRIIELSGLATGLCDARILGHGRFKAKVKKV